MTKLLGTEKDLETQAKELDQVGITLVMFRKSKAEGLNWRAGELLQVQKLRFPLRSLTVTTESFATCTQLSRPNVMVHVVCALSAGHCIPYGNFLQHLSYFLPSQEMDFTFTLRHHNPPNGLQSYWVRSSGDLNVSVSITTCLDLM